MVVGGRSDDGSERQASPPSSTSIALYSPSCFPFLAAQPLHSTVTDALCAWPASSSWSIPVACLSHDLVARRGNLPLNIRSFWLNCLCLSERGKLSPLPPLDQPRPDAGLSLGPVAAAPLGRVRRPSWPACQVLPLINCHPIYPSGGSEWSGVAADSIAQGGQAGRRRAVGAMVDLTRPLARPVLPRRPAVSRKQRKQRVGSDKRKPSEFQGQAELPSLVALSSP